MEKLLVLNLDVLVHSSVSNDNISLCGAISPDSSYMTMNKERLKLYITCRVCLNKLGAI